jgi:N-acetylglucosaminyl-diphospho-decaprenol L-rhamnosyltransferase
MDRPGATNPIAIAVVTHDSLPDLSRFFDGQCHTAARLGAPLVVADNGSGDGTLEFLRERAARNPSLSVVSMGRNAGYAAAVNAAFGAVAEPFVLLLNPDVELDRASASERLLSLLDREPRIAVVGQRLTGGNGEVQPSARRFPSLAALAGSLSWAAWLRPLRSSYAQYTAPSQAAVPTSVDWVLGAAMLIRRAAFDDVSGWDERFFLYMEDTDFCRRCARAGWHVVYDPGVTLHHRYPRSSSQGADILSSAARRRHVASLARLFARDPRLLVGRGGAPERRFEPSSG